jgi:hypothetical protein
LEETEANKTKKHRIADQYGLLYGVLFVIQTKSSLLLGGVLTPDKLAAGAAKSAL